MVAHKEPLPMWRERVPRITAQSGLLKPDAVAWSPAPGAAGQTSQGSTGLTDTAEARSLRGVSEDTESYSAELI